MLHIIKKAICLVVLLSTSGYANALFSDKQLQQRILEIEDSADKSAALEQIISLANDDSLTPKQLIYVLKSSVSLYRSNDDSAGAIDATKRLIKIAKERKLLIAEAEGHKILGILFYYGGEYSQSLRAYQRSLKIYLPLEKPKTVAALYNNIGLAYAAIDDAKEAMVNYQRATELYKSHGDAKDRIDIYFNIAGLYTRLHRYDIAIEMLLKVIDERKSINDTDGVVLAYGDLGNAYFSANNMLQAKFYYEKSLKHYEQTQQRYFIASQSHNLSEVYILLGQFEPAKYYANRAIELGKATANQAAHVGGLHTLANVQFQQQDLVNADNNISLALELAKELKMQDRTRKYLGLKALIQAAQAQTEQSLVTLRRFIELNTQEKNRQLADQLFRYQTHQESTVLQQKLEEIKFNDDLNQLKMEATNYQRNMLFFIVIVTLVVLFFIYRRNVSVKLKRELKQQVAQRTSELEQLTQELQQASLVKSQFMANMSHEIRTPLTSIIGHAQSLVNGEVKLVDQRKEVEVILGNSTHVLTIVNDILDLNRLEVGKLKMNYQSHDIHVVIEELKQLFHEQVSKKGLSFEVKNQLPIPFNVNIDRTRLKQIFINLYSNAIKFTHSGKITIELSSEQNNLIFKISDTGIGIKQEQLQAIFKSFSQADNSISRRFGGAGLGLCLSQELAGMMGGRISVISEHNHGSEFTLVLPCIEEDPTQLPHVVEVVEPRHDELSGTVLLAEDHTDNRHLIARLLKVMGLTVLEASNGHEAISQCREHHIDLILMDIQMPEVNGIDAFNTLREQGYSQPIIALTANAMPHEVDRYLEIGFDDYLAKPIERKRFVATVAHYLKQVILPDAQDSLSQVDMSDLVEDFIASLPADYELISQHIEEGDYTSIATISHRLSGAASMFGYNTMASLGGDIEHKIAQQQYDEADKLIDMLRAMMSRTSLDSKG